MHYKRRLWSSIVYEFGDPPLSRSPYFGWLFSPDLTTILHYDDEGTLSLFFAVTTAAAIEGSIRHFSPSLPRTAILTNVAIYLAYLGKITHRALLIIIMYGWADVFRFRKSILYPILFLSQIMAWIEERWTR